MQPIVKKSISKNAKFIIVALLLVGGSLALAEYGNKVAKPIYKALEISSVDTIHKDAQNLDSDADGLKDWEEVLLGTDPYDAKSKNAKALATPVVKDLTKSTEKLDPLDKVSREFFTRFMQLRQLGISDDKLSQQELIDQTVSSISVAQPKVYTSVNIFIKDDSSTASLRNYGNEIGSVIKNNTITSRNEGIIAKEALQKQDPKILLELDPLIASYQKVLNGLLKVQAPRSVATLHVDLVNAMSIVLFTAESFRKSATDPVTGIQGAGQYMEGVNSLRNSMTAIKGYLTFLGISYGVNEAGNIFVKSQ